MKQTIVWTVVALLIGVTLGFGFRAPIADVLNLQALETQQILPAKFTLPPEPYIASFNLDHGCTPPKYWTGNGCADVSEWTPGDNDFFWNCINSVRPQPPTAAQVSSCIQQTEKGHPR
ncbi:MAG: hypothetical protein AAB613_00135 [Patescibacteria group bacterium]